eukprot:6763472-Pyramimonas_sp.AAC.1
MSSTSCTSGLGSWAWRLALALGVHPPVARRGSSATTPACSGHCAGTPSDSSSGETAGPEWGNR